MRNRQTPGGAGSVGGATANSGRAGGPASGGGSRAGAGQANSGRAPGGRQVNPTKAAPKKATASTASPSGGQSPAKRTAKKAPAKKTVAPSTAPSTNAAPKGPKRGSSTAPSTGQAPVKKTTAKKTTAKKTTAAPAPAAPATPQGRMARVDTAIQARMASVGGRARSTFKRVPGSSQAAGMARRTGATSAKAYNKLPGGKKTKMATAAGISAFGVGMAVDRYSGQAPKNKPKNGDTKTFDGRKAYYRNGGWYSTR